MDLNRISRLEELLSRNPEDPVLGFGLGSAYREAGNLSRAREILEKVIEQLPSYAAAWEVLGLTLEGMNEREEAIRIYERGIRISREGGFLAPEKQMSRRLKRLLSPRRPGSSPEKGPSDR
ncbi:MAG: tetratricopeptide repeat protein [Leptospirales bacterium]